MLDLRTGTVHEAGTGRVIGRRIGLADGSVTRMVGLLGRHELRAGEGIWIRPSSGVHTFGMRFAIDVVGLDGRGYVVRLWPQILPWRLTMPRLIVRSVLELRAGEIAARRIELGQKMVFAAETQHGVPADPEIRLPAEIWPGITGVPGLPGVAGLPAAISFDAG